MRIVCIIPAFNEEATIGQIVSEAIKHCDQVLVVDDSSQDRTGELSHQAGATVVRHLLRLGTGGALSTGFRVALRRGFEVFITMDGDGQHDPDEIPIVLEPILKNEAGVAIGSRFLGGCQSMPLHKKIGNRFLSIATSFASGMKITDSQSGFRSYRREVLEYVTHRARDYSWASEILVLAVKAGFKVMEVPITTIYLPERQRGADVKDGLKILRSTIRSPKPKASV